MKIRLQKTKAPPGMTLIEITLVIAILLSLIAVLFLGVAAYKKGTDRAKCIINITSVQKVARSYANLSQLAIGDNLLIGDIAGANKMLARAPTCPDSGVYTFQATVPAKAAGVAATELYLSCSLATATEKHVPKLYSGW